MPQTIATPDQDALITEIYIAAPPERVFKAISDEQEQRIWWDKKDGKFAELGHGCPTWW